MQPALLDANVFSAGKRLRLAYFVTHPIQYQAPLLKRISEEQDIDLRVFYASDFSVRGQIDEGFGVKVRWDTELLDGYRYEFLPSMRRVGSRQTPGLLSPLNIGIRSRLEEGKFNAVWVHGYHYLTTLAAIQSAHTLGIPVLLRAESTLLADRSRSPLKLMIKRAFFNYLKRRVAAVLSIGEENARYWKHYLGDQVAIAPCNYSVDNHYFTTRCNLASRRREEFRASLGLDPGRAVVLFAAKLLERKRCGDLVEACLKLADAADSRPGPYLLIVGDGVERQKLEARVNGSGHDSIRFLGFRNQSELPSFYDLCDVFVLPSVDEPWGLVVNEVMNAARPVIVSDQVGCRKNLLQDGVNGWTYKAGDVNELAGRLRAVLEDGEQGRRMGLHSRRIVEAYSFDQNVSGLRAALHTLYPGFNSTGDESAESSARGANVGKEAE